jgi:hypothetical protein
MDGGLRMKNKNFGLDFEKAWLDVYFMLEDEAFDNRRVMYVGTDCAIVDGVKMWEVPF